LPERNDHPSSFEADLESGQKALAEGAWEEAKERFGRATAADPDSPEANEGLGWALQWLDEAEASFELREKAYRLYQARGDAQAAARVAMFLGLDYADFRGMAICMGWLQLARRALEPLEETPEHAWLYLWEGHLVRAMEHDLPRASDLAGRAREIAARLGIKDLELLAVALEGLIRVTGGEVEEGMRQLDEAAAAAAAGDIEQLDSVVATCCFLMHACERVRDYERANAWSERIGAISRRWRVGSVFALCRTEQAAVLIGSGDWDAGEQLLIMSHRELEAKRPLLVPEARMQLGELRRRQGRLEEAEALFRETEPRTLAILGLAAIALERGDAEEAAFRVERLRRRSMAEKWIERVWALQILIEARLATGRKREANEVLAELDGIARRVGIPPVLAVYSLARGQVLRATREADEARHAFEDSVDAFERTGTPWEAARVRLELSGVLFDVGRVTFARQEAEAALATFDRLGAEGEQRKARELLAQLEAFPRAAAPFSSERLSILSRREVEVLQLVAEGLSDREVAVRLNLSEHTIHRHVSNILGKLDQPSRTAAVAHATRSGILT
jgi:LuxR family transcriptional regulator, maltose regulon positive regulatory protein